MNSTPNTKPNVESIPGMSGYGASPAQHGVAEAERSLEMPSPVAPGAVTDDARSLSDKGLDAVQGASSQLRDKAMQASDKAVTYTKDEPVKAMLMAAAAGALLMALLTR